MLFDSAFYHNGRWYGGKVSPLYKDVDFDGWMDQSSDRRQRVIFWLDYDQNFFSVITHASQRDLASFQDNYSPKINKLWGF